MNKILLEIMLLQQIDEMKEEMIKIANCTGMNSSRTLKCSQELDKLLNLHIRLFSNKESETFISAS